MDLIANLDLTGANTLGLISSARFGVRVDDPALFPELVRHCAALGLPLHVLGGGSNVVLYEKVDAVIALMAIMGRRVVAETTDHIRVQAGAGENWHELVAWTVEQGIGGLENLAGIPGTVGAAPVQNIGAYGMQVSDVFAELTAFDTQTCTARTFAYADCGFAYRQSVFKAHPGRYIILEVTLNLPRPWQANRNYADFASLPPDADARALMEHVLALRNAKLPDWHVLGNAGSFFQNPVVSEDFVATLPHAPRFPLGDGTVKLSAGWLIEQAGLKGYRLGPVGMYASHALVLVNHGGARFSDVAALSSLVTRTVAEKFGVVLVQEPVSF